MSSEVDVRRAGPDDLDAAASLFEAYLRFYRRDHGLEAARAFLAARLEAGESLIFLGFRAGSAVGFAQVYPTFSSLSLAPAWTLNDLFVDPAARGSGAGRVMLRAVLDAAREVGAAAVNLETDETNTRAQGLYESEGFVVDGDLRYYSRAL